jgi:D-glycero-D-manno-heptose 1,7-bisphosphate phosphatase
MTGDSSERSNPSEADEGLWSEISAADFTDRPALFLDRDGVLVQDPHYLGRAEDVRMIKGASVAVARCNRLGIPVVLVTNQSGIARRLYDWQGFHAVQAALSISLANAGAHLDATFARAHHAEGRAPFNIADHPWRKLNPGMILAAGSRMKLDLEDSWIVGDRAPDIATGRAARLAGGILISSRQDDPERQAVTGLKAPGFIVDISASLEEAVSLLLAQGRLRARTPQRGSATRL